MVGGSDVGSRVHFGGLLRAAGAHSFVFNYLLFNFQCPWGDAPLPPAPPLYFGIRRVLSNLWASVTFGEVIREEKFAKRHRITISARSSLGSLALFLPLSPPGTSLFDSLIHIYDSCMTFPRYALWYGWFFALDFADGIIHFVQFLLPAFPFRESCGTEAFEKKRGKFRKRCQPFYLNYIASRCGEWGDINETWPAQKWKFKN